VFSLGGDPVKLGLAKSLNRPGGNATGISLLTTELEPKRLGLLHELLPRAKMIGVLIGIGSDLHLSEKQAQEVDAAARRLGQPIQIVYARDDRELDAAFDKLKAIGVDALLVCAGPFFDTRRERIVAFEVQHRIPGIHQFREYAVEGGVMSYGVSLPEGYRQVGAYVGQILRGAMPSELPIVQPTRFELIINLKSASTMGIEIPANLLARADEVIE
jgi:putative ABC transport system substrate-binding protein